MMAWSERLSTLAQEIPPSGIRRFFDLAETMDDVISLGVGEPDFVTPWHIREAGLYALERGMTAYTANAGLFSLRTAISGYLSERFGLEYSPDSNILVTVGGSQAIDLALRVTVRPGDPILVPEPTYVAYRPLIHLAGGQAVSVPLRAENGFRLSEEDLLSCQSSMARTLILCNPSNPTGAVIERRALERLAKVIEEMDLLVIADEIYAEILYDADYCSIASVSGMRDRTVVVAGFSKAFAMTGWRLGYAAGPQEIIQTMLRVHQYSMLCAPVMAQMAALEALDKGLTDVSAMVTEYDRRRRLIVHGLRELGLPTANPQGAFYVFPEIRGTGLSSAAFAEDLLRQQRVAVVPGSVFGAPGEGFVRCSYATAISQLERALERIRQYLRAGG